MLRAECWYVILRGTLGSTRISRLVAARATMIGVMVSATLPGRLGEPASVFVIAGRAGDTRNCIALVAGTVLAQTLLNLAALVALASSEVTVVTCDVSGIGNRLIAQDDDGRRAAHALRRDRGHPGEASPGPAASWSSAGRRSSWDARRPPGTPPSHAAYGTRRRS
jgi:hypothetical protein